MGAWKQYLSPWAVTPGVALVIFIVSLSAGLLALAIRPGIYRHFETRFAVVAAYSCIVAACLMYLYWTAGYLLTPIYFDHVEPAVAVTSSLLLHGRQVYPSWQSGEGLYGIIYGPVLYAVHACAIFAMKSIFSTKVAGVLAIWSALIVIVHEVRSVSRSAAIATLALGCVLLFVLEFNFFSFWNRPEPFLVLLTALGIRAFRLPGYQAAIATGILAGVSIGLKPYAVLLFAPPILGIMLREQTFSAALRTGAVTGVCATAVAVAPFLHPNVSLSAYFAYLKITTGHGISPRYLHLNIVHAVFILTPVAIVYFLRRPIWSRDMRWFALALVASTAAVAVIGSKNGAGPYYLLPCIPFALYATVMAADLDRRPMRPGIGTRTGALCIFVAYFCALSPLAYKGAYTMHHQLTLDSSRVQAAVDELATLYSVYPQAEMGTSDDLNYHWTFYRVSGVIHGTPVHLDVPFLMDLHAVGLGASTTERLIESCTTVTEWILPVDGLPFSQRNTYGKKQPLFTEKFRKIFEKNYRPVFKGRYYVVWSCR